VAAIRLSSRPRYSSYRKLRPRDAFDFPELGVAVAVDAGSPARVRVAMTAVASTVLDWDETCDAGNWKDLTDRILAEVRPLDTLWFPPDYRKTVARRFLTACLQEAFPA
jgi:CO/xanthine dehydrogenase FAD-binding subunit